MAFGAAIGALLFFLALWCGILTTLAAVGGWTALASRYPALGPPTGRVLRMQSARFGWIEYNGGLTMYVDDEGLRIAVWPIFRPGHPPMFLPWAALKIVSVNDAWWQRAVTVEIDTLPNFRIRLPLAVVEQVGKLPSRTEGAGED
jgi:hypothetical protein